MREVILPTARTDTISDELVLTVVDEPSALPSVGADRLIWCPASAATGTCSWNLLAAISSAADADSICEHLFTVVVDDAAMFFVPEASLLTANLMLAAARGGRTLGEVIAWVRGGQLAPAAALLESVGEAGAVEDLEAFAASSPGEQAAIWAVVRQVMLPLGAPATLRALGGRPMQGFTLAEPPHVVLFAYSVPHLVEAITIVVDPRSPLAGVANAFRAWLVVTAARSYRPVRVLRSTVGGR
ncbi:hypothetical protein [Nocardia camponoti]|nr:hypothetical protein [Nocardia camponoti]